MKFLAKLAVVVLILGGILFAAGHAMGGSVYSAWYNGALHPFRETFSIGWSSWQNERGDIVNDAKDAARDALDDARDALDDALDAEELELTVGAGSADVKLGGGWSDYRYDVTSGMGSVTANGITLTEGIAGEVAAGSGARHLNLACGMGSINLTTQV